MKTIIKALISLYPKSWRNRYENEFEALLNDVSPTWHTLFDVLGGAIKMQFKTRSWWKIIASCAAVGVVASMAYSLTIPTRYISRAILKSDDFARVHSAMISVEGRAPLTQIINDEGLYKDERTKEPLEDVIERMKKRDILVRSLGTSAFEVSFVSPDPEVARRVTNRLAAALVDAKGGELVDPAGAPLNNGPRRSRAFWMGLALGTFAGVLFALFNGLKVWKLATAMGIAGAALFAGISFAIPDQYASTAILVYDSPDLIKPLDDAALESTIERFRLYPNDVNGLRKLKERLRIARVAGGSGNAVSITFQYPNRYFAQKVTQDILSHMIDATVKSPHPHAASGVLVRMLDPASLPLNPILPNRLSISFVGLVLGILSAILLGTWKQWRRSSQLAA